MLSAELRRLALPVLLEQALSFGVGSFDVFLAGYLGAAETSAIGLAAYVGWLTSLIFGLVRIGVQALVARRWGAGLCREAEMILGRGLCAAAVLGAIAWCLLQLTASIFPIILGMHAHQATVATQYLRWDAGGQVLASFTAVSAAALRASGDTLTPLGILVVANALNILLSPALVFGWGPFPMLGVLGIVLGTVLAQATAAMLMLGLLVSGMTRLRLSSHDIDWDYQIINRIVSIGWPGAGEGCLRFAGQLLFLAVVSRLGPDGEFCEAIFAAHVIGIRIEAMSYLPAEAWGMASASLTGRLLGAGHTRAARVVGHIAMRHFLWYPAIITVLFFFGAPTIYLVMHRDPQVWAEGIPALRLMALSQVPNAYLIILGLTLVGVGETRYPFFCSILGTLFVRNALAWLGGIACGGGLVGAWVGMLVDNVLRAALISRYYYRGKWLHLNL